MDVIEDERLIENPKRVGAELVEALRGVNVGEVRGRGLLVSVELRNADLAEEIVNWMRDADVLINRTGLDASAEPGVDDQARKVLYQYGWCLAVTRRRAYKAEAI